MKQNETQIMFTVSEAKKKSKVPLFLLKSAKHLVLGSLRKLEMIV